MDVPLIPLTLFARTRDLDDELEDAHALIAAQRERLVELERVAEDLISLVSHELRTPATALRGFLELAAETEVNGERSELLRRARQAAERLVELTDDRLFAARVRAGLTR